MGLLLPKRGIMKPKNSKRSDAMRAAWVRRKANETPIHQQVLDAAYEINRKWAYLNSYDELDRRTALRFILEPIFVKGK